MQSYFCFDVELKGRIGCAKTPAVCLVPNITYDDHGNRGETQVHISDTICSGGTVSANPSFKRACMSRWCCMEIMAFLLGPGRSQKTLTC